MPHYSCMKHKRKFEHFSCLTISDILNLGKGSWGQFWPQRSITRHFFLIGWTYSFIFYLILTNTEVIGKPNGFKASAAVKNDPMIHAWVKIDPRNPFTWLFLGTLTKVNPSTCPHAIAHMEPYLRWLATIYKNMKRRITFAKASTTWKLGPCNMKGSS